MIQPVCGWSAEISVTDATDRTVVLSQPARRVVALAPHLTELMFAIGAGNLVVGAADYSDHPAPAVHIPRIGGYDRFNLEAVIALRPDLILGWENGNPPHLLERLERFGLPLLRTDPKELEEIPLDLERLGDLTGHPDQAKEAAQRFRARQTELGQRFQDRPRITTFYQVWNTPLMTVNDRHLISAVIRLCGGLNPFGSLPTLAPILQVEAVLEANPEAIIASGMNQQRPEWLDQWRTWPTLHAVKNDNLFFIPPDLLQRHTPRILDGAEQLCHQLEAVRLRRSKGPKTGL